MKKRLSLRHVVIFGVMLFAAYLLGDILNIPSRMGIPIDNINMAALPVIVNAFFTIGALMVAYVLFDRREIRKARNAQEAVKTILRVTFNSCLKEINLLSNPVVLNAVVKRTDFNAYGDGEVIANIKKIPFIHDDLLMSYIDKGLVSGEMLETYLQIKNEYQSYINLPVTFFDHPEVYVPERNKLIAKIEAALKEVDRQIIE